MGNKNSNTIQPEEECLIGDTKKIGNCILHYIGFNNDLKILAIQYGEQYYYNKEVNMKSAKDPYIEIFDEKYILDNNELIEVIKLSSNKSYSSSYGMLIDKKIGYKTRYGDYFIKDNHFEIKKMFHKNVEYITNIGSKIIVKDLYSGKIEYFNITTTKSELMKQLFKEGEADYITGGNPSAPEL